MNYFKHPLAVVESENIGERTRVWAFAHILSGARIGVDCNICDHTFIENDVVIGNRVTLKNGVQVWDGVTLDDDVFVGPNATFTNDLHPRSRRYPLNFDRTSVHKGATIGANATVLAGNQIGRNAMIGAGAVVTHNIPPNAMAVGNPARVTGFVGIDGKEILSPKILANVNIEKELIAGAYGVRIQDRHDFCGFDICSTELPFAPRRWFLECGVTAKELRGQYAHDNAEQVVLCMKGQCSVVVDDGKSREEYVLVEQSMTGLYIPRLVWSLRYRYSPDAVVLVFWSIDDDAGCLREYDRFCDRRTGS